MTKQETETGHISGKALNNIQKNAIIAALYWLDLGRRNSAKQVLAFALNNPTKDEIWQPTPEQSLLPDLLKQRDALRDALNAVDQMLHFALKDGFEPAYGRQMQQQARAALALCDGKEQDRE